MKGDLVAEYTGTITTWDKVRHQTSNMYIYFISEDHVIDAKNHPDMAARYANDANGLTKVKGLENNCTFVNLNNRIYIKATKNIPAHAELLVDYGEGYWETVRKNMK